MILLSPDHRYAKPYFIYLLNGFQKQRNELVLVSVVDLPKAPRPVPSQVTSTLTSPQPNVSSKIADKPILEAAIDSVCDSWWIVNRQKETAKMCRDRDMNPTTPGLFWTQRDTPALKPHREIHAENNKYVQYWRLRNRTTHILYQPTTE